MRYQFLNKNRKNFFDFVMLKAIARLRMEMSRYYLSFLWWILEPTLTMMVFYFVFGVFLQRGAPDFAVFLLVGLMPWNWFAKSIERTAGSILDGANLMVLVNIPKTIFPLERLIEEAIKQMIVFAILLAFLLVYYGGGTLTWVALPVIMLIQAVVIVGTAFLFSAVVPFFPDLRFIINTGVRLLFFCSGIFYDINQFVSDEHLGIVYANPMAGILDAYRSILMYDTWPDWIYLSKVFFCGTLLLTGSTGLISSLNYVYPKICQR